MTNSVSDRPAVNVDDDFESEFPDARRAATLCAANLVRSANRLLSEFNRRTRSVTNLSATGHQVLAVVEGAGEPLSPHVIADRLLITSGTMTSVLDTLERRSLIRRVPHPSDRRKLLIDITDEARGILDRILPRIHGASRDAFAVLSDAECETLVALLECVQAQLDILSQNPIPDRTERRLLSRNHVTDTRDPS